MVQRSILVLALAVGVTFSALAQQPSAPQPVQPVPRAEVLVLGTYHMGNPGHDIYNMQADDVRAPKRQAELTQLMQVLKKFSPTKIAIESDSFSDKIPKRYADYLAGKYELTSNEIDQIGLRLAKELGHKAVYPVDVDGEFPYQHLVNYAKATGRSKELDEVMNGFGEKTKKQGEFLASHTILETLLWANSENNVAYEDGLYMRLAHFGEGGDWAGADLNSDWYRRNMRIFSNITHLVDSPNERVLVIYGSGHLSWLQHNVASDPTLRLRKLAEFAK
ncbi:MAG: DUF5694 domain-containing protein [Terriglobales bacterium]|jgi:hypothetical protein